MARRKQHCLRGVGTGVMGTSLHLREDGRDEGVQCFNARLNCMFKICVFRRVLVTPNNVSVVKNRKAVEIFQTKDRLSFYHLLLVHPSWHPLYHSVYHLLSLSSTILVTETPIRKH